MQLLHVAPAVTDIKSTTTSDGTSGTTEEYSGPVVKTATLIPAADGHSPRVTLILDHAAGLKLSPGQGCVQCCNQVRTPALHFPDFCL